MMYGTIQNKNNSLRLLKPRINTTDIKEDTEEPIIEKERVLPYTKLLYENHFFSSRYDMIIALWVPERKASPRPKKIKAIHNI